VNTRTLAATVALLGVTGCVTIPREAGFGDVQHLLADRGIGRVHWNQDSDEDARVAAHMNELLGRPMDVNEAVQVALLNNPELQATYEDLSIAQADLVGAGLLKNPVFDGEFKFASGEGPAIELAVVSDFLDVLYIPARKRIAGAAFEQAKVRVAGRVVEFANRTRWAFYAAQASAQLLELRRAALEATAASYDLARRLHEAGNINDLTHASEQASYEQAKLDLAEAELRAVEDREAFTTLLGLDVPTATLAGRLADLPTVEPATDGLERRALGRNLRVAAARAQIESSAQALGLSRSMGLFPDAEAGVAAEREDGEWAIGPAVSLPIPLFNQGQPAVSQAAAELRRARHEHASLAIRIRSAVRVATARVAVARQRAEQFRNVLLPLRSEITRQTQLHYNGMFIGAFDLIRAKQEEVETGAQYVQALRDYWLARAHLDALVDGWFEDGSISAARPRSETSTVRTSSEAAHD
jgi:cobalt-zinc-cadmium efflux system outer membrane protein